MSESNGILSVENLPTVVVVTFTLTVIALALNAYNFNRTGQVVQGVIALEQRDAQQETTYAKGDQIAALEAKITALEAKITAMEAAAPATADAAAK